MLAVRGSPVARMARHALAVAIDLHDRGGAAQLHPPADVAMGHGVVNSVLGEHDVVAGRNLHRGRPARRLERSGGKRLQRGPLDLLEPLRPGIRLLLQLPGVEVGELFRYGIVEFREREEATPAQHVADLVGDLADAGLHGRLPPRAVRRVGYDGDVVMLREVAVGAVEHDLLGCVLGNPGVKVVYRQEAGSSAEERERLAAGEAPVFRLGLRVRLDERVLAERQARNEEVGGKDLAVVGDDLHRLAGIVELAEVARHVSPGHGHVVALSPCGVELAESGIPVRLPAVARGEGGVLLPQQRQRHRSIFGHLGADPVEVDLGEKVALTRRPSPDELVGFLVGEADDVVPGDTLLVGDFVDLLDRRPPAAAGRCGLPLAETVGLASQDVSVTHVLLQRGHPFLLDCAVVFAALSRLCALMGGMGVAGGRCVGTVAARRRKGARQKLEGWPDWAVIITAQFKNGLSAIATSY